MFVHQFSNSIQSVQRGLQGLRTPRKHSATGQDHRNILFVGGNTCSLYSSRFSSIYITQVTRSRRILISEPMHLYTDMRSGVLCAQKRLPPDVVYYTVNVAWLTHKRPQLPPTVSLSHLLLHLLQLQATAGCKHSIHLTATSCYLCYNTLRSYSLIT